MARIIACWGTSLSAKSSCSVQSRAVNQTRDLGMCAHKKKSCKLVSIDHVLESTSNDVTSNDIILYI